MTGSPAPAFTTRPELQGSFGMAASTHWIASATAQAVLERGGNAFDAAVAAAFVLHVVEPHLNGPGGDLCAIYATADEPTPRVLVGQGHTPEGATIEHYRATGFTEVPGSGVLAAAVPGAVVAWLHLLESRGSWELADVLQFAIGYARDGHALLAAAVRTLDNVRELFETHWPTSAAHWLPEGRMPQPGDLVTNEAYAGTLEGLLAAGEGASSREARIRAARGAWSTGFVATEIERFAAEPHHQPSLDRAVPGVISAADLAAFEARDDDAVTLEFRGVTVAKAGPWSQGPVLLQALAILDTFPDERLDPSTAIGIHTITEALKLALADRDAWYGDAGPDGAAGVPISELLSPDYAAERAALIGDIASLEVRPGRPGGREPWLPPAPAESTRDRGAPAGTGEPTVTKAGVTRGDTCHLDVIDRFGNIVSATPSGGWLQSSPMIPALGFPLGSRAQMTWLDAASPSALTPGRRPRTTLSPTLLLRDGLPIEALGTPGGDQQDQWQLVYLLRRLVGGQSPQQAIDAPMFHTEGMVASFEPRVASAGELVVENRVDRQVLAELVVRGHRVTRSGDWTLGRLSAVGIDRASGLLYAAANPRGAQGYAVGR
ncbi:gamma-glutamyltransferase family protein [Lysinimonas soli]|uniref:Gamma-glutamyltransferase family protein n=1 Tax=Lysinimonas soli TaxID=1074233 RepID=A0ABW0NP20_9MICO